MSKKTGWLLGIGIVIVLGSVAGWWFMRDEGEQVVSANVNTTTVIQGSIESRISGTGQIEPFERETIRPTETGEVEEVMFVDGDRVEEGDILITFEQDDNSEEFDNLEQEIEQAEEELEDLQTEYKEAEDDDERDEVREKLDDQMEKMAELQEEWNELLEETGREPIVAPISGELSGFEILAGETISSSTDLGEVVNYDQMQIVVGIDELDINKVELGQQATITVEAVSDRTYTGTVVDIAKEGNVTSGVASFDVTVLLDEVEDLKPGMSAEVSIQIASKENALLLPVQAVQSIRNQYYVLVMDDAATGAEGASTNNNTDTSSESESDVTTPTRTGTDEGTGDTAGTEATEQMADARGNGSRTSGDEAFDSERSADGTVQPGDTDETPAGETDTSQEGQGRRASGQDGSTESGTAPGATMNGQRMVMVEVGIINEDYIEIVSGLSLGDEVILPELTTATTDDQQAFPTAGFGFGTGGFQQGGGDFGGGGGNFGGGRR